jgi:hypothetical protein
MAKPKPVKRQDKDATTSKCKASRKTKAGPSAASSSTAAASSSNLAMASSLLTLPPPVSGYLSEDSSSHKNLSGKNPKRRRSIPVASHPIPRPIPCPVSCPAPSPASTRTPAPVPAPDHDTSGAMVISPCSSLEGCMEVDRPLIRANTSQLESHHGWTLLIELITNPGMNIPKVISEYYHLAGEEMNEPLWEPYIRMATLDSEEAEVPLVVSECIQALLAMRDQHVANPKGQGTIQFDQLSFYFVCNLLTNCVAVGAGPTPSL